MKLKEHLANPKCMTRRPISSWKALVAILTLTVLVAVPQVSLAQPPADDDTLSAQRKPKKHRKKRKRPAPMGVSGGNVNDREVSGGFITCSSGTLGFVIEKNGVLYVVSNNHVLALVNQGKAGDPVNQPGMIDKNCRVIPGDFVANLSAFKRIKFKGNNFVDLALAQAIPGMVDPSGKILVIGVPSTTTVEARVGLEVQKSGRTTGHTKGVVIATGVSGNVDFSSGLINGEDRSAKFKDQIVAEGLEGKEVFSSSGDSGSLVLTAGKKCAGPVGLLFAGSDVQNFTVINPIDRVLDAAGKLRPRGRAEVMGKSCNPVVASGSGRMSDSAASAGPIHSLSPDREQVRTARRAQRMEEDRILAMRGVVAIGVGAAAENPTEAVLKIMVEKDSSEIREQIPATIDGVRTEILVTGRLKAY